MNYKEAKYNIEVPLLGKYPWTNEYISIYQETKFVQTSNFEKMILHNKDTKKSNKNHQIRFLTAAVTSFLTKK